MTRGLALIVLVLALAGCAPRSPASSPDNRPPLSADARAFQDCPDCPQLVSIPAGTFMMGAGRNETGISATGQRLQGHTDEYPQHPVVIKAFAAGRFEVTFDEWSRCVAAGGCQANQAPDDQGGGRGWRPVIGLSWNDAQDYVRWLSAKSGKPYRLLSEAEWEYAARAGSTTAYPWGDDVGVGLANCAGCGGDHAKVGKAETLPVGTFKPNAFGLYDMNGNAEEYVGDAGYVYATGPRDGATFTDEKNAMRMGDGGVAAVLRGGGADAAPLAIRSASRAFSSRGVRGAYRGLRVARDEP